MKQSRKKEDSFSLHPIWPWQRSTDGIKTCRTWCNWRWGGAPESSCGNPEDSDSHSRWSAPRWNECPAVRTSGNRYKWPIDHRKQKDLLGNQVDRWIEPITDLIPREIRIIPEKSGYLFQLERDFLNIIHFVCVLLIRKIFSINWKEDLSWIDGVQSWIGNTRRTNSCACLVLPLRSNQFSSSPFRSAG